MSFRKPAISGDALNSNYVFSRVQNIDCSGNEVYINPAIPNAAAGFGVGVLYIDASGVLRQSNN